MLQCKHHSAGMLIASCNDPAMILQHCKKKKKVWRLFFFKTIIHTCICTLSFSPTCVLDDCLCYCLPLLHSHKAVSSGLVLICVQISSVPWFLSDWHIRQHAPISWSNDQLAKNYWACLWVIFLEDSKKTAEERLGARDRRDVKSYTTVTSSLNFPRSGIQGYFILIALTWW